MLPPSLSPFQGEGWGEGSAVASRPGLRYTPAGYLDQALIGHMATLAAFSADTTPEVESFLLERLRQMPSWRKMALMAGMGETVRALALAGLRLRYPDEPPLLRWRRLADLLLGPELAGRACGPWPEEGA